MWNWSILPSKSASHITSTDRGSTRLTDSRNGLDGRSTQQYKETYRQTQMRQIKRARWLQLSTGLLTTETTWTDSLDTDRQTNTKTDSQVTSTERRLTDKRNNLDGFSGHRQTDKHKNRQPGDFNWAQAYRQKKQPGRILWTQADRQTQKQTDRWLQLSAGLPTTETNWTDALDTGRQTNQKQTVDFNWAQAYRQQKQPGRILWTQAERQTQKQTDRGLQLSEVQCSSLPTTTKDLVGGRPTHID